MPNSQIVHQTIRDVALLAAAVLFVGIATTLATLSRMSLSPEGLRNQPKPEQNLPLDDREANSSESDRGRGPLQSTRQDDDINESQFSWFSSETAISCWKAAGVAMAATWSGSVIGLLFSLGLENVAKPLAIILFRSIPMLLGLVTSHLWDQPQRNCFLVVLLACYFATLALESALIISRISRSASPQLPSSSATSTEQDGI